MAEDQDTHRERHTPALIRHLRADKERLADELSGWQDGDTPPTADIQEALRQATQRLQAELTKAAESEAAMEAETQRVQRTAERIRRREPKQVFVPFCVGGHWYLVEIDCARRHILQYDALNTRGTALVRMVRDWWIKAGAWETEEAPDVPMSIFSKPWRVKSRLMPRQPNASDCGPFVCAAMRRLAMVKKRPGDTADKADWGYGTYCGAAIRYKMAAELAAGTLKTLPQAARGDKPEKKWTTW
jgi:hypothetical protein